MRYHYMTGGGYGGMITMILLLIVAMALLWLIIRSIRSSQPGETDSRYELILDILKHRYVTNQISADQYLDMKRLIIAETHEGANLLTLKEQFARGDISAEDYWQQKDMLQAERLEPGEDKKNARIEAGN